MGDERMRGLFREFVALIDGDGNGEIPEVEKTIPLERRTLQYDSRVNTPIDYADHHEHYEQAAIGLYAVC